MENSDKKKLNNIELAYYKNLRRFYQRCSQNTLFKIEKIIDRDYGNLSLRLLDWFVTIYCRNEFISLPSLDVDDINISYRAQVKTFKKRYFDPFNRGRVKFYYHYYFDKQKRNFYTALGQLNFFKWAISNGILDHVEANLDFYAKEMARDNSDKSCSDDSDNKSKSESSIAKKLKKIKNRNLNINNDSDSEDEDAPSLCQSFY
jgi:hypothetical protein